MAASSLLFPWPVRVGPYAFTALAEPPARFARPRWLSETDYNHQIIRVRAGLSPEKTLLNFWLRVVRAMHYSAGLDDGCPEESFTHAYAAGLIAFIRANPEVWVWFNRQVEAQLSPGAKYARYAAGKPDVQRIAPPRRLLVGKSVYQLETMPLELSARLKCWGDCNLSTRVMRLSAELYGTQLAVIFWHELVHAMHREDGLDDGHSRARFARCQAERTIEFMVNNPQAWRWFLCLTAQAENDSRVHQRLRRAA
ncbi:MAG: hypothetical protein DIU74_008805 [Pseudomonadota bacterium]